MLCDECQKEPASVHVTRIVNDEKTEKHLCAACAKSRSGGDDVFSGDPGFTFHHILAGLFDAPAATSHSSAFVNVQCEKCGLTLKDFQRVGRLGCSHCYVQFQAALAPLIKRIHRATEHVGKYPKDVSDRVVWQRELDQLKKALGEAVTKEAYEEAARLRDEIKELQHRLGGDG